MLLVGLYHCPLWVSDRQIEEIIKALPEIVAQALSVPKSKEAQLNPDEIEVTVIDHGKFDRNTLHFEVTIFANDYEARRRNLLERTEQIVDGIKKLRTSTGYTVKENESFVWILLCEGGFKMF